MSPTCLERTNEQTFRLTHGDYQIIVEATMAFDAEPVEKQGAWLRELAFNLSGRLKRTVSIRPIDELPPSLPYGRIAKEIEKRASNLEMNQAFRLEGEHQGQSYQLEVAILLDYKPTPTNDVWATVSVAHEVDVGNRMQEAVLHKADKYGRMDAPFVVAVWPRGTHFSYPNEENDDLVALYGDNGPFNKRRKNGTVRDARVSSVAVAQLDGRLPLRVYHNPNAAYTLDTEVFKGVPQHSIDTVTGQDDWRDGESNASLDPTDPLVMYSQTGEVTEELLERLSELGLSLEWLE